MTLGKHAHLSLVEAQVRTQDHQKLVQDNADPIEASKQKQQVSTRTVDDLFADGYPDLEKRLKHSGIPYRIYQKEVAPSLGKHELDAVTPMEARGIIGKVAQSGRPTIANDTMMYLNQFTKMSEIPAFPLRHFLHF
ncbi:hypothetical protein ACUN8C_16295 [Kushneria sp. Sum13]|uniref:hypothetical protein n=1 Tax=Kushneria sp. Sum13 TaxID=3459196 RepID=UPI0040457756